MAKLAPDTERLAGSVAPKSKQIKAHLGKARFVHQKANVYTTTDINKYIDIYKYLHICTLTLVVLTIIKKVRVVVVN